MNLVDKGWEKRLAEMEGLHSQTTDGEWAFKSIGEKCYATILGASPCYISGPKARRRKEVDPPISSRGEVSDEFDEKRNDFNEVDFTDRIAESDEQRGGIDLGFAAVMHNQFPELAAAIKELHRRLAERAEDTERLDWLEKHDAAADNLEIFRNGDPPNLGAWEVFRHIDIGVFQGKTLRAAIDAARAEVKP